MTKRIFVAALGLAGALLAGWIWGRSSGSNMAGALETSALQRELLGARAAVLDARVAIDRVDFDGASGYLEDARRQLARADERLTRLGWSDEVRDVHAALADIANARRMIGELARDAKAPAVVGPVANQNIVAALRN